MAFFNVRVYGILLNQEREVLLSDEQEGGLKFTKFPGGGMEKGEGTLEALKREFLEECQMDIEIIRHLYTTDFYAPSIFNDSQVISIYYLVKNVKEISLKLKSIPFDFDGQGDVLQSFRWVPIRMLNPDMVTFPTEKKMVELLVKEF